MDTTTFTSFDDATYLRFSNPSILERDLQTLIGVIKGITSDSIINESEISHLLDWVNSVKPYENRRPYADIILAIREALSDNVLTIDECENIVWLCSQYVEKNGYYDSVTSSTQELIGIIKGIAIDSIINQKEIQFLDSWLEDNVHLKNSWPFDELYNLTTNIIRDKVITSEEHAELLSFCKAISGGTSEKNSSLSMTLKIGFYQIDPQIAIPGSTFCITGVSKKYKRKVLAEKIELFGGVVVSNISSKLNYLVVCDEKNTCWAFTCYGRKIEEAMLHRQQGINLAIVHEFDLYDELENMHSKANRS